MASLVCLLPTHGYAKIFKITDYHDYGPLPVRSQNPLYLQFLAARLEKPQTLHKHQWSFELENNFSNLFEWNLQPTGVGIDLDMELVRTALRAKVGLTDYDEIGLELPFISFFSGFLDAFIQGFHNTLGLPNAGRDRVDKDRFSYRLTQDGNTLYKVRAQSMELSDLVLWNKLQVFDETTWIPVLSVQTALKLPTGRAIAGSGSGYVDFGLNLLAQKNFKRIHSYTLLGFMALGGHEQIGQLIKNGAFTFGQALELNLFERASLITQISGNTSVFKNVTLPELTGPVMDLTVGFTGNFPLQGKIKTFYYHAGFVEDVLSEGPSVDFTVFTNVGITY